MCLPRPRGCSLLKARCRLASSELSNVHQLSLPPRTCIPRDQSARLAAQSEKPTFVPSPITLRSPKALISLINYPLADQCSRFATVHQAYCSLNRFRRSGSVPRSQLIVTSDSSGTCERTRASHPPPFSHFAVRAFSVPSISSQFPECFASLVADSL
jgi:hypothetical protein